MKGPACFETLKKKDGESRFPDFLCPYQEGSLLCGADPRPAIPSHNLRKTPSGGPPPPHLLLWGAGAGGGEMMKRTSVLKLLKENAHGERLA